RRRIGVRMRARGVHTFQEYARLLEEDSHEYDRLLDALTINVTKFFRNAETWRALEPWLDGLWKARRGDVRAWSAGCASGEEPYTVAVALAEAARRLGQASLFPRARVDATDIDRTSLERTETAQYAEAAFSEMPPELARRYFTAESPRRPLPALRRIVRVPKHDLTTEPSAPRERVVKVADWAAERGDVVIVTLGLGSCVAIMLHDSNAGAGAMAHILLPSKSLARDATNLAKFPETAVPLLVEQLTAL